MNLRRIRKLRGLTIAALADKIGMDAATVQRAETMYKTAKLTTYQRCAEALGVTLADLFADEISPVERELLEAFRAIPEERRAMVRDLIALAKSQNG